MSRQKIILVVAIVSFLASAVLLVLAKLMLTNYAPSINQSDSSSFVRICGLILLTLGMVTIAMFLLNSFASKK